MDNLNAICQRRCEIVNRPAYIVLFKGDDSDFTGNQTIYIDLNTELDLSGYKAHFRFMDYEQTYSDISSKRITLVFPSSQTSKFPLGAADASLVLIDSQNRRRTINNRIHIVVTNSVNEAYSNEDPQAITVSVSGTYVQKQSDWNETNQEDPSFIKNKPTIPAPVTIDPALSTTSENPVQNKVVAKALNTGFTEWEFSGELDNQSVKSLEWSDENERWEGVVLFGPVEVAVYPEGDKDATSLSLLETDINISATRHLITPTKTSQLTNDSGFLTQHQDISGKLDGSAAYLAWDQPTEYDIGEIVSYKGGIYRCKSEGNQGIPPDGEFGPNVWDDVTIGLLLNEKQNALSSAQLAAVNSGATAAKVSTWDGYAAQIAQKLNASDVVPPTGEATAGQAADALKTYEGLNTRPTKKVVNAALAQKADASDLPYAMVTPGEWAFSELPSGYSDPVCEWNSSESVMLLTMQYEGDDFEIGNYDVTQDSLSVTFAWDEGPGTETYTVTATRASLPGHLLDRANNLVDASTGDVALTLPAYQEGKVRDLLVNVTLGDDGTNPYAVTVNFPSGETNTGFKVKGNASAPLPAPDAAGEWLFSFSESSPHKMAVSLAQLQDATVAGGS